MVIIKEQIEQIEQIEQRKVKPTTGAEFLEAAPILSEESYAAILEAQEYDDD